MEIYEENYPKRKSVHKVLMHSYIAYFAFFFLGMILDLFLNIKLEFLNNAISGIVGFVFLLFATSLIIWAQKTTRKLNKESISKETFCKGPYRFSRNPTHIGLLFLLVGFGLVYNTPFVLLLSIIYFIVAKMSFLKEEEKILTEKYGDPYVEYKNSVRI